MELLNRLLLNMLIIITPLLLYQVFWIDRLQRMNERTHRWLLAVICAIVSLCSMSYPFSLSPGFQYDFRLLPLVICFFFAGLIPSLGVAAVILTYRLYLGGPGSFLAFFSIFFAFVLLWYCKKRFNSSSLLLRPLMGMSLGMAISLIPASVFFVYEQLTGRIVTSGQFVFFLMYSLIQAFTMGLVAYIIRQMERNFQMRKQIQQNEKIHLLSEMAASFAHEIRNPMTVIRGFMQMIKQGGLSEEKRQIYNQMIMEEMDKAQSIINDYLSFAKPQLESIELLDAKTLILEAIQSLEAYAELCHVEIETHLQDKMMISANADKFVQCIVHLCKNGIESMPNGGKLQIVGAVENQTACIDIIDQGVGMTTEEINRLGTPFYSTRGKGTGLGMMVTYRTIQHIHGRIDVTSELGKGTCFTLLIPSLHSLTYH